MHVNLKRGQGLSTERNQRFILPEKNHVSSFSRALTAAEGFFLEKCGVGPDSSTSNRAVGELRESRGRIAAEHENLA